MAAAVVDRSRWAAEPFDAWAVVRRAWSSARDRGVGAAQARTAAMQALEARWAGARVRDVTALPEPAAVPAECGSRPDTALHRLYGAVTFFDPDTGHVGFSPTGGHPAIAVPIHRIVALSGDRRRRGPGEVPAHEPVDEL
ncbi:hypothetical protein ADK77_10285 [Streptomyces antibioticus]|nr:hypothetical protein [Streptomyces antibioticus]KOG72736.1 hypothetical protein ADK77_10285 [Streptomyces antibioticus]